MISPVISVYFSRMLFQSSPLSRSVMSSLSGGLHSSNDCGITRPGTFFLVKARVRFGAGVAVAAAGDASSLTVKAADFFRFLLLVVLGGGCRGGSLRAGWWTSR